MRTAKREAREAEEAAREMGLWDEFYGTGAGDSTREGAGAGKKRKSGGKASSSSSSGVQPPAPAEEDTSALAALIASRQRSRESAFDALLDKYSSPNPEKRRKPTKGKRTEPVEEPGDLPVSPPQAREDIWLTTLRRRKMSSGDCRKSCLMGRRGVSGDGGRRAVGDVV